MALEHILDQLLDDDLECDPVTVNGLTNHLPMVLIALDRLDVTDRHLSDWADRYRNRLMPRRTASEPIAPDDLPAVLGTGRRYADLLLCFQREIDRSGVDDVLDRHLTGLLDGMGGAAFHGVIRLAYSVEHGRPIDIAAGLAYLADSFQPVLLAPDVPTTGRTADPAEVLVVLAEHPDLHDRSFDVSGFSRQFAEVARDPAFLRIAARLETDGDTLARVALIAHTLYRSTSNFFALHTMTATHATRIVTDRLSSPDDRHRAAGSLARAVAAAYVVIGAPTLDDPLPATDLPGWDAIESAAGCHRDEHAIKLAYTCREEQVRWGDPRYRATAATVVGV